MSNKKIISISLIFGLISLAMVVFIIYPLFKDIRKNSQELINIKRNAVSPEEEINNISQIKKIYQEIKPDSQKMENLFIDPEVPIDLIKFLEERAKDLQVSIKILSVNPKINEDEKWNYLEFQINLVGSFGGSLRFLKKIENSQYLVETQNLTIKKLTEQELTIPAYKQFSLDDISINLTLKVFTKR